MLRKGWVSPKSLMRWLNLGCDSWPKRCQSKYSFQDTDMTFYPQSLVIKKVKQKMLTMFIFHFLTQRAEWKEAMEATHNKIIEASFKKK